MISVSSLHHFANAMPLPYFKCFSLFLLFWMLGFSPLQAQSSTRFRVMAWNILHGGNDIEGGQEQVMGIIQALGPDVVLMVETYGSGQRIADSLGYHFHLIAPEGTPLDDKGTNLSIFSKFPFGERIDTAHPFYLGGREILVDGKSVRVFSNWFHYLPWHDAPETMGKSAEELLEWEQTGKKHEMIGQVLPVLQKYASEADSIPFILGGDMNTPSHLDWGESTRGQHGGLVVPWQATKILEDMGLVDTYRALHPDPLTHPGITWDVKGKRDEHRIDYIFYKSPILQPVESETYKAFLGEEFKVNGQTFRYPSDHGIVLTTFELR